LYFFDDEQPEGFMKSVDKYVYPGTHVLINKFGCRDAKQLQELEARSTMGNLVYLQLHPVSGVFDFKHLKDIHYFIFQDVFDWAGQIRTVDIGKNNLFCRAVFINDYAKEVFDDFYTSCQAASGDKDAFVEQVVSHYADMNALHPFREGNGRTERLFLTLLVRNAGFSISFADCDRDLLMIAAIHAAQGELSLLRDTLYSLLKTP
jgi:cell filamentation protein